MKRTVVVAALAALLIAGHLISLRTPTPPQKHRMVIPVEIDVLTATIKIVAHPQDHASRAQLHLVLDAAEQEWLADRPHLHVCKRVTLIQNGSCERCIWVEQRPPKNPSRKLSSALQRPEHTENKRVRPRTRCHGWWRVFLLAE